MRSRSGETYGFVFPGKESGLFGHFFELHAMAGDRCSKTRVLPYHA